MKMRNVMEGAGAALLLLFPNYLPFFHPQNHDLYHHELPVTNLIGGILVDMLGVTILVTGLLFAIQFLPPTLHRISKALFAGMILWCIVGVAILILYRLQLSITYGGFLWRKYIYVIPLLLGILDCILPRYTQLVVRAARFTLAASAFSAFWIIPQLLHLALAHPAVYRSASPRQSAVRSSNSNQRIVWILFDELSYHQTFDHPAPDIKLPNFDRLRAESVSFSNLKPIGFRTDRIIPSLILGKSFEKYRSSIDGNLSYWDESQRRWVVYDPNATLFALAQSYGWNTGIDGWYNPYCRIFAPVLNSCYWSPDIFSLEKYGASEEKSALANAVAAPNKFFAILTHRNPSEADEHLMRYRSIMAHTTALIDDNQLRFIYFHLPAPHPPGIYDRQRHMLRAGGTYLDNLVLADETLGTLLQEINASPLASQTTIIVTSDHSWRISLYRNTRDWSTEEEHTSRGIFDDRPVLLIHFPGQQYGNDIHDALSEMIEHDMIAEMLRGQINSHEELTAFASQYNH